MKQIIQLVMLVVCYCLSTATFAQQPFSNCSAAFVSDKMIVDTYTTKGKCRLSNKATGELTVQTVELSPTKSKALDKINFTVAIRDKATNTLHMYSRKSFRQVSVERVLASCKKGDYIVLLPVGNQYALPHNEILVQ